MSRIACRSTTIVLDLSALRHNLQTIRARLPQGTGVIAVVKDNAYGHGAREIAEAALRVGAGALAVATVGEALELRAAGIGAPVLVFGPYAASCVADAQAQGLTLTVFDRHQVDLIRQGLSPLLPPLRVHLKVDTGMRRYGFRSPDEAADAVRALRSLGRVEVEGLYSHYAAADDLDGDSADSQFARFQAMAAALGEAGLLPPVLHFSNSAAALRYPERSLSAVRLGIALYGLSPAPGFLERLGIALRPVLTLRSSIAQVVEVPAGTAVSYGGTYVADRPRRLATVPVGYGDGYDRRFSNRGEVLVRGRRVPVVGRVTMDAIVVDVTDVPQAAPGEEVVVIGRQGSEAITAEALAEALGTIPYEVVTRLSRRIPRVVVEGEADGPAAGAVGA
ncbi:MAG: Alanine racemase [Hydrogenibacillus schlegelii]|uniref:Alanine racemase n=1 Tax=Hydrogenibacillus schlegelii TaxID=1484 RepID=A0A2T5GC82_HYDSH|nr:alanine racemase [Hydrogenibacillus schlegelii]PTQ53787.1 MAG: Alanine racemase [Hydrogenibacillus schlegelii]